MPTIKPKYPLYLKKSPKRGWGVYCSKPIKKGRIFEVCPIIYLEGKFLNRLTPTPINEYRFEYRGDACALVLGYGMLYNHAGPGKANSDYDIDYKNRVYKFRALRDIPAHTELCHDYNWDEDNYREAGIRET